MLARVAVIIVLGSIAYSCMLSAPFKTMDDRISITDNPTIKSTANIPEIFRQGYFKDEYYYRPLVNLSFMGEYRAFGLTPFFYNLDNLILHILNALLVFLLVSRLTNNMTIGFWTGFLFVIHPVQWEAVCNISGRAILMSAFFVLSSFFLFLEFYKNRRWICLPLMMATFSLGLLCKESAGVLPFVIVSYLFLDKTNPWANKLKYLWSFLIVIVGYALLRHHLGITKLYHANDPVAFILGFVTFLRSVITDLRLFVFPIDLHFDRCLPIFRSLSYPSAIFSIVFWGMVLMALYYWRRSIAPFIFFLISWFVLELLPVSQLVSGIGVGAGHASTAEHFLYLACIPVFIGIVMAFQRVYELNGLYEAEVIGPFAHKNFIKPLLLKFLAGGFLMFLLLTAVEQSIYASSEFNMLKRSLYFEPDNPRIQSAMGLLSVFRNDIPDAEKHFRAAIKAEPLNPTYHISLGTALCQQRKWIEGLEQFVAFDPVKDKALVERQEKLTIEHILQQLRQGKTFDARGWLAIGIYYAKAGQNQLAIDAFLKSVSSNPGQTDSWFNLGSIYEAEKNWPAARKAYTTLLQLHDLTVFQKDFASRHLAAMDNR